MLRRVCVLLLLLLGVTSGRAAGPTITIDTAAPLAKVSPLLYGLMTEEINHAYDGGLYAELIHNRAFLDSPQSPAHWTVVQRDGSTASIALDRNHPLNQTIPVSLRLDVTQAAGGRGAGIANEGFWGIPVKPKTRYRASFFAKSSPGFDGPITLAIESSDGRTTYASGTVSGVTTAWKRHELTLETGDAPVTADARFALTLNRPGTVWLSLVSIFPPT